jgi:hypothetical protein
MNNANKTMEDKQQEQKNNFIEGDNVVPQGGEVNKNDKPDENKSTDIYKQSKSGKKHQPEVNPPSNPPQKPEKKVLSLRSDL